MVSFRPSRRKCTSSSRITAAALLSWVALSSTAVNAAFSQPDQVLPVLPPDGSPGNDLVGSASHEFTLRHVFHKGTKLHPNLHRRLDVQVGAVAAYEHPPMAEGLWADVGPFEARSNGLEIQRLVDRRKERVMGLEEHARKGGYRPILPETDWTVDEVAGPNITDKKTVVSLAKMAACAYNQGPDDPEWLDVGRPFNRSADFGWQKDGLRGHVFADKKNDTIVISIKGTSMAVFDGYETTTNDKENDNLFFGCCCGQGGSPLLRYACECATDTYSCNNTCVRQELKKENRYWSASVDLYHNVTDLYPNVTNIWLVGHSLGGGVASLLGLTVGQPAVTFEAPGDALAASRLGLPVPPGLHESSPPQKRQLTGAFHFGHNADPAYTGTCNGWGASCVLGGYALESECHTGMICEYDTQKDLGWRNVMTNHGIRTCITGVYEYYDEPAKCVSNADCDSDCFKWKFYESNHSDSTTTRTTTTTSSTSMSFTRTETCKTPGWWGCLDESTTYSVTRTLTSTLTTETCASYGWFGHCYDPITTTETLTTTVVKPTDVAPTTTSTSMSVSSSSSSSSSTTVTCTSYGWFGRCLDDDGQTTSSPSTSTSSSAAAAAYAHGITAAPDIALELR